ncbi:MAG: hypothetical protein DHS20C16_24110 [Phycisphaerae bacterium]|nr:MAG: hypothetical protein DHS20C16_24110 [Phycisphaerae bacterium]
MQRIRILIARDPDAGSDLAVEWYAGLGSGSVDLTRPLPPGRQKLWPESPAYVGHVQVGHLVIGHLDTVYDDGHLECTHVGDGHLEAGYAMVFDSPRYVFGRFRHALRMFDGAGNATGEEALEYIHTINSSPPAPLGIRRSSWNASTSQLQFEFTPVRFNPVIGN